MTREEFLDHLHNALTHLYNADQLRRSPLAGLFGVAERFDTSSALRQILMDAIEELKPRSSEPDQSRPWRTYDSLYCCFIQQLNQQVVADQLCISPRQLRREQRNALEYLADRLWARYSLDAAQPPSFPLATPQPDRDPAPPPADALLGELNWLMDTQPVRANRLDEELQAALAVVQPLAAKEGVALSSQVAGGLPGLAIHPAALNQILVSLLGMAISAAAGGRVALAARPLSTAVEIEIRATPPNRVGPAPLAHPEYAESLRIAAELTRLSGGQLVLNKPAPGQEDFSNGVIFPARLWLPALEQFPVLLVDDNEDSLQLYKRYAAGTRYHLVCTPDTAPVMELVESLRPRIIVLDIMMPKENGWIVLGRLRQHPITRATPVIVCTILPQEGLALSLGASAFLKKPVTRESFLQALDRQFALLEPEYPS